jgi:hypothetical protein
VYEKEEEEGEKLSERIAIVVNIPLNFHYRLPFSFDLLYLDLPIFFSTVKFMISGTWLRVW